ncbi:MAG: T9SS type A sorting domain-containing protein, partial [Candidatus Krumholzibacteria bacterium]|nr:T9SS type A sorting domain-containing protein [Candidatus Krumholzibacteria bacterium]
TAINFVLPTTQHVRLSVYDATGRLVRTLVDDTKGFGTHSVEWNGTDNLGNEVGSGVYFYRLETGKFQQSRKMVLLK